MNLMFNMKDINKILAKIESYVWEKQYSWVAVCVFCVFFCNELIK